MLPEKTQTGLIVVFVRFAESGAISVLIGIFAFERLFAKDFLRRMCPSEEVEKIRHIRCVEFQLVKINSCRFVVLGKVAGEISLRVACELGISDDSVGTNLLGCHESHEALALCGGGRAVGEPVFVQVHIVDGGTGG